MNIHQIRRIIPRRYEALLWLLAVLGGPALVAPLALGARLDAPPRLAPAPVVYAGCPTLPSARVVHVVAVPVGIGGWKPFTRTQVRNAFERVAQMWACGSGGRVALDVDVLSPVEVPRGGRDCSDLSPWADPLDARLRAAGHDVRRYDNVVYLLRRVVCDRGGRSERLDGRRVWHFMDNLFSGVVAHELGHSRGLEHAARLSCTDDAGEPTAITGHCLLDEYGDTLDPMGDSGVGYQYSATNRARLGWLSPDEIVDVTWDQLERGPQIVPLACSDTSLTGTLLVRASGPSGRRYEVELRCLIEARPWVRVTSGPGVGPRVGSALLDLAPATWEVDDGWLRDGHPLCTPDGLLIGTRHHVDGSVELAVDRAGRCNQREVTR